MKLTSQNHLTFKAQFKAQFKAHLSSILFQKTAGDEFLIIGDDDRNGDDGKNGDIEGNGDSSTSSSFYDDINEEDFSMPPQYPLPS